MNSNKTTFIQLIIISILFIMSVSVLGHNLMNNDITGMFWLIVASMICLIGMITNAYKLHKQKRGDKS